jgi:hypothetical protein
MANEKTDYQFTLILKNVDPQTPSLEDSLFESGCDDALINFKNNTVYLDFDRASSNLQKAVITAIHDIESSPVGAQVTAVTPDDFVTESDIAKRLNKKRQLVSLWVKGTRRTKHPFPNPVMKLSERSPCWRWREITAWLYKNELIKKESVDDANFLAHVNVALEERDPETKRMRCHILSKLQSK